MGPGAKRPAECDKLVDEAAKESFPASDPPAFTAAVAGAPKRAKPPEETPGDRKERPAKRKKR